MILDGHMCEWLQVLSGVLQGFILGPILLSVYINDLESTFAVFVYWYTWDQLLYAG